MCWFMLFPLTSYLEGALSPGSFGHFCNCDPERDAGTRCQVGSMDPWVMDPYIKPYYCETSSAFPRYLCVLHASRGSSVPPPTHPYCDLFNRNSGTSWSATLTNILTYTLSNVVAICLNAAPFRISTTFSHLLGEVTFSSHPDYLQAFPEMHLKSLALFWKPVRYSAGARAVECSWSSLRVGSLVANCLLVALLVALTSTSITSPLS